MLQNQLLSCSRAAYSLPTRCVCLGLTVLSLTGCGFVLAPIELVTAGALSAVVKEFDRQLISEGAVSDNLAGVEPAPKLTQSIEVSTGVTLYPASELTRLVDGTQFTRQSIMADEQPPPAN